MKRWLILQNWHISALFIGLGLSAVVFAWTTFNLYQIANRNFRFIADYGLIVLVDGGVLQFLEVFFPPWFRCCCACCSKAAKAKSWSASGGLGWGQIKYIQPANTFLLFRE